MRLRFSPWRRHIYASFLTPRRAPISRAQATGSSEAIIKEKYKQEGDLGVVAMTSRSTQRVMFQPAPLTIRGVFEEFRKIGASTHLRLLFPLWILQPCIRRCMGEHLMHVRRETID